MDQPKLSIGFKIWFNIHEDGNETPFIGEQKIDLLRAIQDTGSLNEAAAILDLEYHKAWDMIEQIQKKIEPYDLVNSKRGRSGGTSLTSFGHMLIDQYEKYQHKIGRVIENIDIE